MTVARGYVLRHVNIKIADACYELFIFEKFS